MFMNFNFFMLYFNFGMFFVDEDGVLVKLIIFDIVFLFGIGGVY